ncbi:MAG TPA: AAA family ATPase [Longimicrobiales bacterium]|nr:AAA family ATPase [Longimicrobiales bacterium]
MFGTEALADLELLIKSRYGLIHLDTIEYERAEVVLRHLSDQLTLPFFTWSRTRGIARDGHANGVYETQEPAQALAHIVSSQLSALYMFPSFDGLAQNELIIERLKEVAAELGRRRGALVIAATGIELHDTVRRLLAVVRLPEPSPEEFRTLIEHIARDVGKRSPVKLELSAADEARLLGALRGLTLLEAEKVLTRAMVEDNRLTVDDIMHVMAAKKEIVEREGVLEYYPAEESFADVADLAGLKEWLRKRRNIFQEPERAAAFGLSFPRGLLLIGVPGCGKSLCARAVATEWSLPLLRLDTGSLYNKFVGETESNFRRAMRAAEKLAPCVLFIDELEKAFATGGTEDGGVSMRVLGTFLTWLQERKADVFVVATANDVSRLPPEFLRKGRFDEIFFVDLPDAETRAEIFRIHLRRRGHDPAHFDYALLNTATRGFSGAEIEQVVVAALYTAFNDNAQLSTELLLREAATTKPLAIVMAEKIQTLREWSRGRTVPAGVAS